MGYNQWGIDERYVSRVRLSILLKQTFFLVRRGYFRWLVMSSPAYILAIVLISLLIAKSHALHLITLNTNISSKQSKLLLLQASNDLIFISFLAMVGLWWGQVFSVRDIAARYFSNTTTTQFILKTHLDRVAKAFLASLVLGIGYIVGYIFFIIPAILWYLYHYFVITDVAFNDNPYFLDSFRKSRQLIKYNEWRVFGLQLILGLIQIIVAAALSFVLHQTTFGSILILLTILSFLFAPLYACAVFVFYAELRMQKENITPEQLAADIGLPFAANLQEVSPLSDGYKNSPANTYHAGSPYQYQGMSQDSTNLSQDRADLGSVPPYGLPNQSGFNDMRQDLMIPDSNTRVELGSLPFEPDLPPFYPPDHDNQDHSEVKKDDGQGDPDSTGSELV